LYKVILLAPAKKFSEHLYYADKGHFMRIRYALGSLAQDPFQGKPLKQKLKGKYSLRVGMYRIIYGVDQEIVTVYVFNIGHRRNIYP